MTLEVVTSGAFSSVLASTQVVALVVRSGVVAGQSVAAIELFGEAGGCDVERLFDPHAHHKLAIALAAREAGTWELQALPAGAAYPVVSPFLVIPGDGEQLLVQVAAATDAALYEQLIAGNNDLTNLTRELATARAHLERVGRQRDELTAALSHDLRSILHAIHLQATAIQELAGKRTPEQLRGDAAIVKRASERMLRLIENILETSRLEAGATPELGRVAFAQVVGDAVSNLRPIAARAGVHLDVDDATGGRDARANEESLYRVVSNLVDNAIRHSPRGSTIRVRMETIRERMVCTVADEGEGVPLGDRAAIFERFRQGPRRHGAAGLGLFVARRMIELMEGTINVTASPSGGAAFVFDLPAVD